MSPIRGGRVLVPTFADRAGKCGLFATRGAALEPHTLQPAIGPFLCRAHVTGDQLSRLVSAAPSDLPFAFAGEGSGRAEASAQAVVLRSRQDPDLAKG